MSGFLAGAAGVCYGFAFGLVTTDTFDPTVSFTVISMVVIGGLGSILGSILGAIYLIGLPAIFGTTPTIEFLTSCVGLLAFILYLPGGLAQLLGRFGDLCAAGLRKVGQSHLKRMCRRTIPWRPPHERWKFRHPSCPRSARVRLGSW